VCSERITVSTDLEMLSFLNCKVLTLSPSYRRVFDFDDRLVYRLIQMRLFAVTPSQSLYHSDLGVRLRELAFLDWEFESHQGHGCLSLVLCVAR
jgi:hypothetical protein